MNISIEKRHENSVLSREEVEFKMEFDSAIPSREQAKSALSTAISIPKDRIVVISISSKYGSKKAHGTARIYSNAQLALGDKNHLLVRDKMAEKKAKKPKKSAAIKAASK